MSRGHVASCRRDTCVALNWEIPVVRRFILSRVSNKYLLNLVWESFSSSGSKWLLDSSAQAFKELSADTFYNQSHSGFLLLTGWTYCWLISCGRRGSGFHRKTRKNEFLYKTSLSWPDKSSWMKTFSVRGCLVIYKSFCINVLLCNISVLGYLIGSLFLSVWLVVYHLCFIVALRGVSKFIAWSHSEV